jgi:tripartite-type tricarboxylate transporter receptor subunit TctC
MKLTRTAIRTAVAAALVTVAAPALGQSYPSKPIRATIGTPTGGPGDVVLRGAGQAIQEATGQSFIVENRVSVSGLVSAEACAKATPDGHTLCSCDQQIVAVNPSTRATLPYNPSDITPIALFGFLAAGVHVHPSVPYRTLQEMLAAVKAKPKSVTFGTFGLTSASHLYLEWWRTTQGIDFLNVPYKAASLAWPAMLAGEVQASYFALTSAAVGMVKAGKARTLAVTLDKRLPELPDVPTYKEAGIEFPLVTWFGLCGPRGTSRDVVTRLNGIVNKGLLGNPELKTKFVASQGIQAEPPAGGSPEAFAKWIASEQATYAKIVKVTGVKEE